MTVSADQSTPQYGAKEPISARGYEASQISTRNYSLPVFNRVLLGADIRDDEPETRSLDRPFAVEWQP